MKSSAIATLATALFVACSSAPTAAPTAAPGTLDLATLQTTKIRNLAMPAPGLITAGQPTEAQLEQIAKLGVQKIICLRPATEDGTGWEEAKAQALGVQFVRLPIANASGLTVESAQQLAKELQGSGATMVCCGSSNRVGALLAMKAFFVDKQSKEQALAFGKAGGLKALEKDVAGKLQ